MTNPYPSVAAWHAQLRAQINEPGAYPLLADALVEEDPPYLPVPQIGVLLGCGWTLDEVEAAIEQARRFDRSVRGHTGETISPKDALRLISILRLPPAEFQAWSASVGHNLWSLVDQNMQQTIAMWRALLPGEPLAAQCMAAGISPDEAGRMRAAGTLTDEAISALIALRTGAR